jgi:transposase-like protein
MAPSKVHKECPRCGSREVIVEDNDRGGVRVFMCLECDHVFEISGRTPKRDAKPPRHRTENGPVDPND